MQETKTLTLPVTKKQVVVKGYVTGLIDQEYRKIMMSGFKIQGSTASFGEDLENASNNMSADLSVEIDANNKLLELMVISIDAETTDVLNKVLSLPKADVDYLTNQVKEVENESKVASSDPKAPTT